MNAVAEYTPIFDKAQAEALAMKNTEQDEDWTYRVVPKAQGYAIAVYDETNTFLGYL